MKYLAILLFIGASACGGGLHAKVEPVRIIPTLQTTPAIPMVQTEMRVTCILPESNEIPATFAWGIADVFKSAGPVMEMELTRVISTPCQPFRIYCIYKEGGKKEVTAFREVEPVGQCQINH